MKKRIRADLYSKISGLLWTARQTVARNINYAMVYTYYKIGRMIVEEEQQGKKRAGYGEQIIKDLSAKLTHNFGKGFSITNLKQIRTFYITYSHRKITNQKGQTLSDQFGLSWSHYLFLMRIYDVQERNFYEIEAAKNNWSLRELNRQFDSSLYERLALSKNKKQILALSAKGQIIEEPKDIIKEPYVLEFLGLPEKSNYSESNLEQKIIEKLESFLLELGKGFSFVGRQVRFTFDDAHFRVDLVFYNRILKCFVLIDLKIGKLTHQDLGQMQMYVNYYDRFVKLPEENKTVGIVLCKKKNETLVEITLPETNNTIFAGKYQTILPSKAKLKQLIDEKK
jgi:predicted nuclease of restriction endonuclease-like (RecB) superfamily